MKSLWISMVLAVPALAQGPSVELPPDGAEGTETATAGSGRRIPMGSYGEAFYLQRDKAQDEAVLKRLVLFLGHAVDEQWRIYSEIEVEGEEEGFEVEMEQAFIEYRHGSPLGARAGLLLMPVGMINVIHESPTFHGNERPRMDRDLVPTTWRELGAGLFGAVGPIRYEAYLVRGVDASGFSADKPIRGGRIGGKEGRADSAGGVVHLGWTPLPGLDLGGSAYYADASQGNDALDVGVTLLEADARFVRSGFEARAQFASLSISGTADLDLARAGDTEPVAAPAESTHAYYAEAAYDVLYTMRSKQSLSPFVRYEQLDLGAEDPIAVMQGGLTFRPRPQLAFKGDLSRTDLGKDTETKLALGMGFMF